MAKQSINVGTTANDKKGDSLRAAFQKVNANFTELYTALGLNSDGTLNLGAFEFSGSTMSTTDSTAITIDQSVTVSSDLTVGGDILPITPNGGNLGSLTNPFKSLYVSTATIYFSGVPLSLGSNNELKINNVPLSQTANVPADISDLTDTTGLLGGDTGDVTFTNSTISVPDEDEFIIQAKDADSFASAKLNLEPVYGEASLSAYSTETVETFTLANGDFATGVWQNNGFGNGAISFTGAQNIGDFFQNTLLNLTPENVSITVNSEPAFEWNGGTSGAGSSTPGFQLGPTLVPASPITITSIVFRYRTQSKISVNQGNTEIRLTAQDASIEMSADQNVRVFADNQIEIQSGDTLSISAGESISISNGSSDSISISTGDLNFTAFDDVNFRASDSFLLRNTSASAPIRIRTDDNNTQKTWTFGTDGSLTVPGDIRSEGNINIDINLSDSTLRRWRFGEDGDLTFPDATVQTTAFTGNAATVDITNTNGIDTNYSITFVENRDGAEILRADVDLTFNSATNTLTAGNVEVKQTITGGIIESGSDFIITSQPNPDRNNACNIGIYPGGATGTASEAGFVSITGGSSDVVGLSGGDVYIRGGAHTNGGVRGTIKVESILKIDDGVHEKFQRKSNVTGTVEHDCSSGHIFYHQTPDANWTVNLTNLNLASDYATTITLVIEQGATGRIPSAVQVDGNAVPLIWQANTTPTPSNSRIDVVTFSILYDGLWTVLGQLTGF
jgi:hypothetical protein